VRQNKNCEPTILPAKFGEQELQSQHEIADRLRVYNPSRELGTGDHLELSYYLPNPVKSPVLAKPFEHLACSWGVAGIAIWWREILGSLGEEAHLEHQNGGEDDFLDHLNFFPFLSLK